jgi:hypothetical protein
MGSAQADALFLERVVFGAAAGVYAVYLCSAPAPAAQRARGAITPGHCKRLLRRHDVQRQGDAERRQRRGRRGGEWAAGGAHIDEHATPGLGILCSIHLSYEGVRPSLPQNPMRASATRLSLAIGARTPTIQ